MSDVRETGSEQWLGGTADLSDGEDRCGAVAAAVSEIGRGFVISSGCGEVAAWAKSSWPAVTVARLAGVGEADGRAGGRGQAGNGDGDPPVVVRGGAGRTDGV